MDRLVLDISNITGMTLSQAQAIEPHVSSQLALHKNLTVALFILFVLMLVSILGIVSSYIYKDVLLKRLSIHRYNFSIVVFYILFITSTAGLGFSYVLRLLFTTDAQFWLSVLPSY